jgi:hypothetical protein
MVMMHASPSSIVFWAVVATRFLLPLGIPFFPLPAILGCLIVDAADQPIFQTFTSVDLSQYQAYDKALDIFYLSIAVLTMYRNWKSRPAIQVGRALFYLRLVGVLAFESTGWRWLLFLFPNAFEYYFIFYEAVRSRWSPTKLDANFYLISAGVIWILKLPQEWWIHLAKLDVTDQVKIVVLHVPRNAPWLAGIKHSPISFGLMLGALLTFVIIGRAAIHRFAGPPEHARRLKADPLPPDIDEAPERDREMVATWHLFDRHLVEKIVLVGFITVIFAHIVPGVNASPLELVLGTTVIVTINAFLRLRRFRIARSLDSGVLSFLLLLVTNTFFAAAVVPVLRGRGRPVDMTAALFFLLLLTLIVTLYDRWRPVFEYRFRYQPRRRQPAH